MTPLSLFELNEYIRQVISLNFTEPIWIKAEINQISYSRGHCYLELIEKKTNADDIIAQASAAIWFRNLKFIEHKTGPHLHQVLKKGLQVLLKAKVEYNERYGLKFSIEDIDTSFTLGQLELQRREIINQLQSQGLLEKNKALRIPIVLQRIAIISSEKAAGLQDFINHLQENAYDFAFRCELFSATMQGKNVERDILKACKDILAEKLVYDAIIIIRGGGSKLDLSAFDSLKLCTTLANMPYPVITGIGHDIDQSIADLVAHTALKTPTAVANFIIDHNLAFESSLLERLRTIESFSKQIIRSEQKLLAHLADRIKYQGIQLLHIHQNKIQQLQSRLSQYALQKLTDQDRILRSHVQVTQLLDPFLLLKRGYSVTTISGKLVKSKQDVSSGELMETRVVDGNIISTVQ